LGGRSSLRFSLRQSGRYGALWLPGVTVGARARFAVADYLEVFDNRKRHHSALGYRTRAQALRGHRTVEEAA
jgi:hypothetical protein